MNWETFLTILVQCWKVRNKRIRKAIEGVPKLICVFVIKGPAYYCIFASRGRCCAGITITYQIVTGRSKNVEGPYLNKEGQSWVENS